MARDLHKCCKRFGASNYVAVCMYLWLLESVAKITHRAVIPKNLRKVCPREFFRCYSWTTPTSSRSEWFCSCVISRTAVPTFVWRSGPCADLATAFRLADAGCPAFHCIHLYPIVSYCIPLCYNVAFGFNSLTWFNHVYPLV